MSELKSEITRIQSRRDVLATPSDLCEVLGLFLQWTSHFWIDGASIGDVVNGSLDSPFGLGRVEMWIWQRTFTQSRHMGKLIWESFKMCAGRENMPLKRFIIYHSVGASALQSLAAGKRFPRMPKRLFPRSVALVQGFISSPRRKNMARGGGGSHRRK